MSQYPGGQPPQDPYYGQPPPGDPYAPTPSDPYFGWQSADPYAQQGQPADPWQAQAQADAAAQQQAWYAQQQQQAWYAQQQAQQQGRARRGGGAVIVGIFLVLLGAWILFRDQVALEIDIGTVWPVAAVGLGVLMVIAAFIPRRAA